MALTAAERAKRYRDRKKENPNVRAEFLRKERDRIRRRYVPIEERTDRNKRKTRRAWRQRQSSSRKSRSALLSAQAQLQTPPNTPTPEPLQDRPQRSSRPYRSKPKAYREIQHLRYKLTNETRRAERFRKRFQRERAKHKSAESPSTRTRKDLSGHYNPKLRKTLLFHNALVEQLRQKYKGSNGQRTKHLISQLIRGSILKKYRMLEQARRSLTSYVRGRDLVEGVCSKACRATRSDKISTTNRDTIIGFYLRDDNSRIMPGKKDTITRRKSKKQRRVLCESMKILYAKCKSEYPKIRISYSFFCTLRPFWVVLPKLSDRNTCLCKRHDNMQLMANKLHLEKVISTNSLSDQYQQLVCDVNNQQCMYGVCNSCSNTQLKDLDTSLVNTPVTYQQWTTRQEERMKSTPNGEKIQVKVTSKESLNCLIRDLYEKFQAELKPNFTTHAFNIGHQYRAIRLLRESISADEVAIHIDFSENYSCKSHKEIQSVHFGASHNQATLHTGVAYLRDKTIPFCTVSNSTRHDPSAIWAHLQPILAELTRLNNLSVVHFISDGPTTQYRNKKNFYLASILPFEVGFQKVTWNFLEAGHGKGAADGIGGTLKRTADRLVAEGKDITDADALYRALLPDSAIKLILVEEDDVIAMDGRLPTELRPLSRTMKIHQVSFSVKEPGVVKHRILSCFCRGSKSQCDCFGWTEENLPCTGSQNRTQGSPEPRTFEPIQASLLQPISPSDDLLNKWCVVCYDHQPYPGVITNYDDDSVEVKAMSRVGTNSFYWPTREDRIWYDYDKILTTIPEPSIVGSRHLQIDSSYWAELCKLEL